MEDYIDVEDRAKDFRDMDMHDQLRVLITLTIRALRCMRKYQITLAELHMKRAIHLCDCTTLPNPLECDDYDMDVTPPGVYLKNVDSKVLVPDMSVEQQLALMVHFLYEYRYSNGGHRKGLFLRYAGTIGLVSQVRSFPIEDIDGTTIFPGIE